jgi:hypothetical protein
MSGITAGCGNNGNEVKCYDKAANPDTSKCSKHDTVQVTCYKTASGVRESGNLRIY